MLQRILVIILLMMVEISTLRECFVEDKYKVEAQDIEDNNEQEGASKEVTLEKYLIESLYFQFAQKLNLLKNTVCDDMIATGMSNPFQAIYSPPPQK